MLSLLFLFMLVNLAVSILCIRNIQRLKFAKEVLNDVHNLFKAGVITEIQAKVFLNDMHNPLDIGSIMAVKQELNRIVEAQLNAQSKSTNR